MDEQLRRGVDLSSQQPLNRIQLVPVAAMQNVLSMYLSATELCTLGSTCKYLWSTMNSGEAWRELVLRDRRDIALPIASTTTAAIASLSHPQAYSWVPLPEVPWKTWYRTRIYVAFVKSDSSPSKTPALQCTPLVKVLIIGQNGIGKTSFLRRYLGSTFTSAYRPTRRIWVQSCEVKSFRGIWKVQFWDSEESERFRAMRRFCYRGTQGIFVMYNVCNQDSFRLVSSWSLEIQQFGPLCKAVVLGTQIDQERTVSYAEGKALADELKIPYAECSAKTGEGVSQAVDTLFRSCVVQADVKAVVTRAPATQKTNSKCAVQ